MRHLRLFIRALRIAIAMLLAVGGTACSAVSSAFPGRLETLTYGMDTTAVNALIYIALEQGFFEQSGLRVTIKTYASGLAAASDMLDHHAVDAASVSEFVLAGKALVGDHVRAWASIDKFMHNYLIARKDRGIATLADLKGKRIGVPLLTAAEFYVGRLLELEGIGLDQVTLVNTSPQDLVDALAGGSVDAVTVWQPNARALQDRMGASIVVWPAQSEQATYAVVVSTLEWMNRHPEGAARFIKAVSLAEDWYTGHPEETKALLKERLQYDDVYINAIWPEHQFQLSLDQSLILAMEDESRWLIRNRLTTGAQTPIFSDFVYADAMKAVQPDAVNIIP